MLVHEFGVARSSVREALRVLESAGMIRSHPGDPRGPEVLPFSTEPLTKSFTRLAAVAELSLAELLPFRMMLESNAHFLAAQLRTDEQLLGMERAIARMRVSIDHGYAEFSNADLDFHHLVAEASRNRLIQLCGEAVRDALFTTISAKIHDTGDRRATMFRSLQHHIDAFNAIRDGNPARAAHQVRTSLYAYYAEYLQPPEREILRSLSLIDGPGSSD